MPSPVLLSYPSNSKGYGSSSGGWHGPYACQRPLSRPRSEGAEGASTHRAAVVRRREEARWSSNRVAVEAAGRGRGARGKRELEGPVGAGEGAAEPWPPPPSVELRMSTWRKEAGEPQPTKEELPPSSATPSTGSLDLAAVRGRGIRALLADRGRAGEADAACPCSRTLAPVAERHRRKEVGTDRETARERGREVGSPYAHHRGPYSPRARPRGEREGRETEGRAAVLTVNSCIKVRLDLQADKSPVVIKGPFFPRVVNPRYQIHGTMCNARIQSSKAKKAIL
jgi:hypothetical protein